MNENLQDSSKTIGKTKDAMQEYDSKLASASKALGQLKRGLTPVKCLLPFII